MNTKYQGTRQEIMQDKWPRSGQDRMIENQEKYGRRYAKKQQGTRREKNGKASKELCTKYAKTQATKQHLTRQKRLQDK